jgi:hypothetical protein
VETRKHEGSILDHVKHIDAGETVGSKDKKENPTLPKDVHMIPALRKNSHPR